MATELIWVLRVSLHPDYCYSFCVIDVSPLDTGLMLRAHVCVVLCIYISSCIELNIILKA